MKYLEENDLPGLIINVDFEKAFDSLEWAFLKSVLQKFNFGASLIHWVETFYKNISSCVINNGTTSKYFDIERGVRQGDPLSPYLFILCIEILACYIRQNDHIHGIEFQNHCVPILQYADDTSGLLRDLDSAKHFFKTLEIFGLFSGLKLNRAKTEGMWLGSLRNNRLAPLGISWSKDYVKILGIYASYDPEISTRMNFEGKIAKAKSILRMWMGRNLTLAGRIQIVKSFIMSQFLYQGSVIEVPQKVRKEIEKMIFQFIWSYKTEKNQTKCSLKRS